MGLSVGTTRSLVQGLRCNCGEFATKVEIVITQLEYKSEVNRSYMTANSYQLFVPSYTRFLAQTELYPVCETCCSKGEATKFVLVAPLTEETKQKIERAVPLPGPEQRSIRLQDDE